MKLNTYSPLRYPGGKNKLTSYIQLLINTNNLNGCTYIEPYTGGGALALNLLFNNVVNKIIINDLDHSIYAFWYSVLYHTEELCRLIQTTDITIENWYIQKDIQKNKSSVSLLELGFSTLFLNRTNRSGILKAGVIGGKSQCGTYKLDCRFNKDVIIKKIRMIASRKSDITLYNLDSIQLLETVLPKINDKKFIFLDPPYYVKGASLYNQYYVHTDHQQLAQTLKNLNNEHWVLTYDFIETICDLFGDFDSRTYHLQYSLATKRSANEIMFFSNKINKIQDF